MICGFREDYNEKDLMIEIQKVKSEIEKIKQASQQKLDEIFGSSPTIPSSPLAPHLR